jgi:uncharacterized protein YcbK (DUF882 family)
MKLKASVKPNGIKPELILALCIAKDVYQTRGYELVITSLTDSHHRALHSYHYSGNAADLRTRNVPVEEHQQIADELKEKLGQHYNVVLEKDHIHLAYKPVYQS